MFEFLMIMGTLLGIFASLGLVHGFIPFSAMWIAYLSLFLAGHTFLSFQWDILLLEVGLLSAVAQTPLFRYKSGPRLIQLLFRFIFWKLMFMAGVVKLQSNCPTWLHLTALEVRMSRIHICYMLLSPRAIMPINQLDSV
jgi:membrane-bound ClpP family serine protease